MMYIRPISHKNLQSTARLIALSSSGLKEKRNVMRWAAISLRSLARVAAEPEPSTSSEVPLSSLKYPMFCDYKICRNYFLLKCRKTYAWSHETNTKKNKKNVWSLLKILISFFSQVRRPTLMNSSWKLRVLTLWPSNSLKMCKNPPRARNRGQLSDRPSDLRISREST